MKLALSLAAPMWKRRMGESRINSKPGLGRRPRLFQPAEICQGGGEKKMGERPISVALDRASPNHKKASSSARRCSLAAPAINIQ